VWRLLAAILTKAKNTNVATITVFFLLRFCGNHVFTPHMFTEVYRKLLLRQEGSIWLAQWWGQSSYRLRSFMTFWLRHMYLWQWAEVDNNGHGW
jgi:hypothetical protein